MKFVLWRDRWLKPLNTEDLNLETCQYCNKEFGNLDFVTSCEFCEIDILHDNCANDHLIKNHERDLMEKAKQQMEKQLHKYQ